MNAMRNGIVTTIDSAGRLVLPKEIRDEAGIVPGMSLEVSYLDGRVEIEPLPREVVTKRKGRLRVAVPVEEGEPLSERTVRRTISLIRKERGGR